MTHRQPPAIAEWLLVRAGASDALIGDLHEAFRVQRSALWYWQQTAVALIYLLRTRLVRNHLRSVRRLAVSAAVVTALVYTSACGPKVDVATGVKVDALATGWKEVEVAHGTKLVPAMAFRLTNVSDQSLPVLQVNAIFHRGGEEFEWGNDFRRASGSEGLAPGASTRDLVLASVQGYTGAQEPVALLSNSRFVDARVDLFGKYASTPWVKIGEFPIDRALISR